VNKDDRLNIENPLHLGKIHRQDAVYLATQRRFTSLAVIGTRGLSCDPAAHNQKSPP
jgi:hypothetical protein